jgi:hypothetical protein
LCAQGHGSLSTIAAAGDNIDLIVPGLIARLVVLRKWPLLGPGINNWPIGMPRRWNRRMRALLVHGGVDVPISVDAERIRKWTGEVMGDRSTKGRDYCLLPRKLRQAFVRKRRTCVLIRRIVFVAQSRAPLRHVYKPVR